MEYRHGQPAAAPGRDTARPDLSPLPAVTPGPRGRHAARHARRLRLVHVLALDQRDQRALGPGHVRCCSASRSGVPSCCTPSCARRADLPGPGLDERQRHLRDQAWILSYQVLSAVVIFGVAWAGPRGLAVRQADHDRRRPRQRPRAVRSRSCCPCCRRPRSRGSSPTPSPRRGDGAPGARRPGHPQPARRPAGGARAVAPGARRRAGRELPDDRLPRARRVQPEPRPRPAGRRVLRAAGRGRLQPDAVRARCPRSSTAGRPGA